MSCCLPSPGGKSLSPGVTVTETFPVQVPCVSWCREHTSGLEEMYGLAMKVETWHAATSAAADMPFMSSAAQP